MASSHAYWGLASEVQSELQALAALGDGMYSDLEADDDPETLADHLLDIKIRFDKLTAQVSPTIVPLRKAAKALSDIPAVKL